MKQCKKCKRILDYSCFSKTNDRSIDGFRAQCRDCINQRRKNRYVAKVKSNITFIDGEVWKDVVGLEGIYCISDMGRVMSIRKNFKNRGNECRMVSIILKQYLYGKGYYKVQFSIDGKRHNRSAIHQLVADAFIPNPNNLPEVNHKNGIKTDNRIENLEWVTSLRNKQHAIEMGLKPKVTRESKVTPELVKIIKVDLNKPNRLRYIDLAEKYQLTEAVIGNINRGNSWYWVK